MNIESYQEHAKKLNMLAEIKIFEELKTIHIEDEHEHPFIFLCLKCNQYAEEILHDFVTYSNELAAKQNEEKQQKIMEELKIKAIEEDIKQQMYKDSLKYDKNGNINECVGVS